MGARTLVMGILNITPDSFADGGRRLDPDRAAADALRMVADGADILDIGGESTRPGALPVPADEEWRRIEPVLAQLRGRTAVPISVDTYKASVADKALAAGAAIVNDVSGLTFDPDLATVVARHRAAVVLMHHRGRSDAMYDRACYGDVAREITAELRERGAAARAAGIAESRIIYDPGLGFAKQAAHTLAALAHFPVFAELGRPLLSGPSRKSFLKAALGDVPPAGRVWGTAAAVTASVLFGAHIVRVHDVAEMTQVVRVADAIRHAG
jgi:dihydropteroate synthase